MPELNNPKQSQQNSSLSELDFNRIIGGPLSACVNAQEEAARATLEYLYGVVFRKKPGHSENLEPVTVTFYFESGGQVNRLIMPLICIVPVPYLQIEQVNLTFQATVTESSMQDDKVELKAKYSAPGDSAAMTDVTKEEFKSKRCIDVNLCVTAADMPMGISKLIEIFNNQLVEIKEGEPVPVVQPPILWPSAPHDQHGEPVSKPVDKQGKETNPDLKGEEEKPAPPPVDSHEQEEKPAPPADEPQPRYNIKLITVPRKQQKSAVVNIVNSLSGNSNALTGNSLNNILKSAQRTIPIETDLETAKDIVAALKKKSISTTVVMAF